MQNEQTSVKPTTRGICQSTSTREWPRENEMRLLVGQRTIRICAAELLSTSGLKSMNAIESPNAREQSLLSKKPCDFGE
jgi:hypothetical protein